MKMSRPGFTLIEMAVVLGIIIALMAISIPFFSNFSGSSNIKGAEQGIVSALETTRSYAIAENKEYLLDCNKTSSSYKITHSGGTTVDKTYFLPQGVSFETRSGILFTSNGGLKADSQNIIIISNTKGATRTITVDRATGSINVTP